MRERREKAWLFKTGIDDLDDLKACADNGSGSRWAIFGSDRTPDSIAKRLSDVAHVQIYDLGRSYVARLRVESDLPMDDRVLAEWERYVLDTLLPLFSPTEVKEVAPPDYDRE